MKSIAIYDNQGNVTSKLELDQTYFDGKINGALLYQAVRMYLANKRLGCASTKTRGEVSGGGRKPWKQKGTGRARVGSIRSPLWKGGGTVFGPHPKDFKYQLPKKIKKAALQHSLNGKVRDEELMIVENISLNSAKTSEFYAFLKALKVQGKALFVVAKIDPKLGYAAQNIPGITVKMFDQINAYDVLTHKKVIFLKEALESLIKLGKKDENAI